MSSANSLSDAIPVPIRFLNEYEMDKATQQLTENQLIIMNKIITKCSSIFQRHAESVSSALEENDKLISKFQTLLNQKRICQVCKINYVELHRNKIE
jgi:hypothetical protein